MMKRPRKNRSNCEKLPGRHGNVDRAKVARAKAAIKVAKSKSPQNKKFYQSDRWLKAAVDLESPKSLLVNVRLKSLINMDTYSFLSPEDREDLNCLLPACDQRYDQMGHPVVSPEALNNEFFAKACVEWCRRLGEGEFQKERLQGDPTFKVKQFGVLNGTKSQLFDNFLANSTNIATPLRCSRRRARNSTRLARDDAGSLSSEASLSLQNNRTARVLLRKSTCECICRQAISQKECPALRDHDYCAPLPKSPALDCRCRFMKKPVDVNCSNEKQANDRLTSLVDGASANSSLSARHETTKRRAQVSRRLKDFVVDSRNLFSRVSCGGTDDSNRSGCDADGKVLPNAKMDIASSKANGCCSSKASKKILARANGILGGNRNCSANWLQHRNCDSASRTATSSHVACNLVDSADQSCLGENGQASSFSCASLRSLNQARDNAMASENSSDSYPTSTAVSERTGRDKNFNDAGYSRTSSPVKRKTDGDESDAFPCDRKRSFVKFIGIQKIALRAEKVEPQNCLDTNCLDTRFQNGKILPQFIIKEVEKYVETGMKTAHSGVYSSSNVRDQSDGTSYPISVVEDSHIDRKIDSDVQEKEISRIPTGKDSSCLNAIEFNNVTNVDCIWEAVEQQNTENCDLKC